MPSYKLYSADSAQWAGSAASQPASRLTSTRLSARCIYAFLRRPCIVHVQCDGALVNTPVDAAVALMVPPIGCPTSSAGSPSLIITLLQTSTHVRILYLLCIMYPCSSHHGTSACQRPRAQHGPSRKRNQRAVFLKCHQLQAPSQLSLLQHQPAAQAMVSHHTSCHSSNA